MRSVLLLALSAVIMPVAGAVRLAGQDRGAIDKPTREVPREGCVTEACHTDIKARKVLHGPLNVNACDGCHVLTSAEDHAYELKADGAALCSQCHEVDLSQYEVVHEPLAEGACLPCHDPHGSALPGLLRADTYPDLCRNCHDDVMAHTQSFHGPAMAGACNACHAPHGARYPKLLALEGHDLCLSCHQEMGARLEHSPFVHDPARFDCELCHDPHATDQAMQLLKDPISLCGGCHEDILHTVETATVEHAAVTTKRSCLNCHDAHASDHPRMLRENAMNLCFECHNREITLDNGRTIANIEAIIETGKSLHGPTAESDCTACHDIHGGGHTRLLRYEYPSALYYPFKEDAYALCFSCHDRQMVDVPRTTALTDFRNGEDNLHYAHVHKTKKGRTCRICHDAHAADSKHNIHDEIPFGPGGWMLPIHFEQTEHGGRCAAGCHRAYEYNRIDPVAYPGHEATPDEDEGKLTPPGVPDRPDKPGDGADAAPAAAPTNTRGVQPRGALP